MTDRPQRRRVPWSLLAAMGSLMVVFLVMALVTGEWVFLVVGVIGFGIGLAPILSRS